MTRSAIMLLTAAALAGLASCSSGPSGGIDLTGSWSGVATLPNGFTTSLSLTQSGATASGTMRVAGSFIDRPVTGQVVGADRTFTWLVADGCELWGGTFIIDPGGDSMAGPVVIDRSGCQPSQSNGSGTISLDRQ